MYTTNPAITGFRKSYQEKNLLKKIYDYTGQHKISFWDESSRPLLILGAEFENEP